MAIEDRGDRNVIPVKTNCPTVAAKPAKKALNGYILNCIVSTIPRTFIDYPECYTIDYSPNPPCRKL